jgi:excisionase family DNA binding protein
MGAADEQGRSAASDRLDLSDAESWPVFMTPEELALVLRMSVDAVRRKLRSGELPGRKIGEGRQRAEWRTPKNALLAYMAGENPTTDATTPRTDASPPD